MLGVECVFRFQSREHKESVLSNYADMSSTNRDKEQGKQSDDEYEHHFNEELPKSKDTEENEKPKNEEDEFKKRMKQVWTSEQDNILIDHYDQFKDLGTKPCFEFLA